MRVVSLAPVTLGVLAVVLSAPRTSVAQGTPVTTCGQVVTGSAYLTGDLDCSAVAGDAVIINGGNLDLAGFTLTAGGVGDDAIGCPGPCKVFSSLPGATIIDDSTAIIDSEASGSPITLENVTIDGNGTAQFAIEAFGSRVTLTNVVIQNLEVGVDASKLRMDASILMNATSFGVGADKFRIRDSQFTDCATSVLGGGALSNTVITGGSGYGVAGGERIKVIDSVITGKGSTGVISDPFRGAIKIIRSDVSGNGGDGVFAGAVRGKSIIDASTITNNAGSGIRFEQGKLDIKGGSVVTGNGLHGAVSGPAVVGECGRLKIVDSTVTGNGLDVDCGVTESCADVSTCEDAAKLVNASCDTSYDSNSGFPGGNWGICSLD